MENSKFHKFKKGLSISLKINFMLFFFILIFALVLILPIENLVRSETKKLRFEQMYEKVKYVVENFDENIEFFDFIISLISTGQHFNDFINGRRPDTGAVGERIYTLVSKYQFIREYIIAESTGKVLWSNLNDRIGINISDRDYFNEILKGNLTPRNYFKSELNNNPIIVRSFERKRENEEKIYVIYIIDLFEAGKQIFGKHKIGRSGYFFVLGYDGATLFHVKNELLWNDVKKEEFYIKITNTYKLEDNVTNRIVPYTYKGTPKFCVYNLSKKFDFFIAATINKKEVEEIATILIRNSIIETALSIIIILVFLIITINQQIIRKVKALFVGLERLSSGDLSSYIMLKSGDQLGNIIYNFNLTIEKLNQVIRSFKKESTELKKSSETLSVNLSQIAASINQITSNIKHTSEEIDSQATSVTQTTASVEQMTRSIENLSKLVEDLSASITESSSAVEQMIANIASVTTSSNKAKESVDNLVLSSETGKKSVIELQSIINLIAKQSEKLLEANNLIISIANKTNLLSMNAAIEAAHAGDAGRGFAVVADEIRKLAEIAGNQSKEVEKNLKEIKTNIDKMVLTSKNVNESFDKLSENVKFVDNVVAEVRQAMIEQNEGGKQVLEALKKMNEISSIVKTSSYEMSEGTKQINEAIMKLNTISAEVKTSITEIDHGISNINSSINNISKLGITIKELSERNEKEIDFFKLEKEGEEKINILVKEEELKALTYKKKENKDTSDEQEKITPLRDDKVKQRREKLQKIKEKIEKKSKNNMDLKDEENLKEPEEFISDLPDLDNSDDKKIRLKEESEDF
ncbi:MAG: methyl-accepting chemotaxis protein [Spirochaetes bacterium]|nr:methyl-accepting chemotaxis protein [Spirochaetota bacterium]